MLPGGMAEPFIGRQSSAPRQHFVLLNIQSGAAQRRGPAGAQFRAS